MGKQLPIRIEVQSTSRVVALVGKRVVGTASAWFDSNENWVMMKAAVRSGYRRRGIATEMYSTMERVSGRQLKPAISLSDDAFEFWKLYRPEAVANDLRHQPELLGRKAQKEGRIGTIVSASGGIATIEFDDGDRTLGTLSCIRRDKLPQHLL